MKKLEMTENDTDKTVVIYDKYRQPYPLSISQKSGNIELFQSIYLTEEEAIELSSFLLDVLHARMDKKYLDVAKETLWKS